MTPLGVIATVAAAMISAIVGPQLLAWYRRERSTSASNLRATEATADATMVETAQGVVRLLEVQLRRQADDIADLTARLDAILEHQASRDAEMRQVRSRNRKLERRVSILERELLHHDIPIPSDYDNED